MEIIYQDNRVVVAVKPAGVLSTDEPGGMPLAGDRKYGLPEDDAPLALWAYQLSFTHPQTDKEMTFTCPPPETAPWVRFALPAEK